MWPLNSYAVGRRSHLTLFGRRRPRQRRRSELLLQNAPANRHAGTLTPLVIACGAFGQRLSGRSAAPTSASETAARARSSVSRRAASSAQRNALERPGNSRARGIALPRPQRRPAERCGTAVPLSSSAELRPNTAQHRRAPLEHSLNSNDLPAAAPKAPLNRAIVREACQTLLAHAANPLRRLHHPLVWPPPNPSLQRTTHGRSPVCGR